MTFFGNVPDDRTTAVRPALALGSLAAPAALLTSLVAWLLAALLTGCGVTTPPTSAAPSASSSSSSSSSPAVSAPPAFSPAQGTYAAAQTVTLTDSTTGAAIYYTTDGTTPTAGSMKYAGPITADSTTTITAIAAAPGYANSPPAAATFTINALSASGTPTQPAAPPTPAAQAQTLTIADATAGAAIYYTTDGSTPTTSSTLYTGPITVNGTETVRAIAIANGFSTSTVSQITVTPPQSSDVVSANGTPALHLPIKHSP